MNVSLVILCTAMSAGADPVPTAAPVMAAPAVTAPVMATGTGCGGCGGGAAYPSYGYSSYGSACCESKKPGLLDRLKARFGRKKGSCCESSCYAPVSTCAPACAAPVYHAPACAPAPCAPACHTPVLSHPVYTGFTTSCCESAKKPGLLDRLRAKFKKSGCCEAAPTCGAGWAGDGCGGCGGVATAPVAVGTTPPVAMPVDPKK